MSTINPRNRLHRRPWFMPAVRGALWAVSGVGAFVIAFLRTAEPFNDSTVGMKFLAIPPLAVLAVSMTDANTKIPDRKARYLLPFLLWMLGLWAASAGAGITMGGAFVRGPALLVAGLVLLVGTSRLRAWKRTRADRARSIRLTATSVPAVVTEVTRNRSDNVVKLWNVTLRFQDSQGTDRWHKLVHHSRVPVGSKHWIRYDPKKPSRKSTLFVEWQTRR